MQLDALLIGVSVVATCNVDERKNVQKGTTAPSKQSPDEEIRPGEMYRSCCMRSDTARSVVIHSFAMFLNDSRCAHTFGLATKSTFLTVFLILQK